MTGLFFVNESVKKCLPPGLEPTTSWSCVSSQNPTSFNPNSFQLGTRGQSRPLFLYYCLFNTVYSKQRFNINYCRWLDSNRRPLESEATTLPTAQIFLYHWSPLGWVGHPFCSQLASKETFNYGSFSESVVRCNCPTFVLLFYLCQRPNDNQSILHSPLGWTNQL